MKKTARELIKGEVFTTSEQVMTFRDGDTTKEPYTGKQRTDLRFDYFSSRRGARVAFCRLNLLPGKAWVLVPVDAECEIVKR